MERKKIELHDDDTKLYKFTTTPLAKLAQVNVGYSHSDSDGMGSIPATPDARNVPL